MSLARVEVRRTTRHIYKGELTLEVDSEFHYTTGDRDPWDGPDLEPQTCEIRIGAKTFDLRPGYCDIGDLRKAIWAYLEDDMIGEARHDR